MLQVQSMRSSITWPGEDMRRGGAEEGTVVEDVGVELVPGTGNKAHAVVVGEPPGSRAPNNLLAWSRSMLIKSIFSSTLFF